MQAKWNDSSRDRELDARLLSPKIFNTLRNEGFYASPFLNSFCCYPEFCKALLNFKNSNSKHRAFVDYHTESELKQNNVRVFLGEKGTAGIAVWSDGNITSLFKNPACKKNYVSVLLMLMALLNGGKKLDCYDGFLTEMYSMFGFYPVARVPFNDEYKPDDWGAANGTPDVVFMIHNGDSVDTVFHNIINKTYPQTTQKCILTFQNYDEAYAYRDSLLKDQNFVEC